jgi:hypothetical protein
MRARGNNPTLVVPERAVFAKHCYRSRPLRVVRLPGLTKESSCAPGELLALEKLCDEDWKKAARHKA